MGIVLAVGSRTEPGRLGDHLAGSAEAPGHLRRLGMRAVTLRPLVGTDVGTIMTMINYENNADFAASWGRLAGDAEWQAFAARTAQGGASVQVESSLFADVDPSFQPSADRPMGVVMTTQWRAKPGRLLDFMGNVMTSVISSAPA